MTPDEYQTETYKTAKQNYGVDRLAYLTIGLTGEAGEVANNVKKIFRDKTIRREEILEELGDCLWYIAQLCEYFTANLEDVMHNNIEKLRRRYSC